MKKWMGVIVGGLIVVLGIVFLLSGGQAGNVSIGNEYARSYTFGADFYTEMYGVTYNALNQLNNIGSGISTAANRTIGLLADIRTGIGLLIIAIGLMFAAYSYMHMPKDEKACVAKPENATNTPAVEVKPIVTVNAVADEPESSETPEE